MSLDFDAPALTGHALRTSRQPITGRIVKGLLIKRDLIIAVALGLSLPIFIIGLWSLAVHLELLAPQILPAPSLVWSTTWDLLRSGDLLSDLSVSFAGAARISHSPESPLATRARKASRLAMRGL